MTCVLIIVLYIYIYIYILVSKIDILVSWGDIQENQLKLCGGVITKAGQGGVLAKGVIVKAKTAKIRGSAGMMAPPAQKRRTA